MASKARVQWHSKFNVHALLQHASQLRQLPCSCDLSQQPLRGSLNWVIFLSFKDGIEWVFRSPTTGDDSLSLKVAQDLLESEVATMKYIKLNSSIPVPDIFDYSSTTSNAIGIPFILMSKAPGTQLEDLRWDPHQLRRGISSFNQRPNLSQRQKEKVMQQLGRIVSELSKLQFNKIGSLFEDNGQYCVGKCLSPAFIFHDRDTLEDDVPQGPFEHNYDYYNAMLSVFLLHVQELRLQHNVFFAPVPTRDEFETSQSDKSALRRWEDFVAVGSKIDSGRNRLDYCTAGYICQQMIPFISGESASVGFGDGFGLHHPDLSTSNIFVDDDLNITCIIDWAFASTVPMSTCLMTPSLPHPRDDMDPILDSVFRLSLIDNHLQRQNAKLADTKFANKKLADAKLLADLWEHNRRAWLFTRLVLLDGTRDYYYFKELYTSVYKPQEEINISSIFKVAQNEDYLVELAETLADDEENILEVLKDEEQYFAVVGKLEIGRTEKPAERECAVKLIGIERRAIARKITMVSELSQNFVADKRLWRWIEEVMRDRAFVEDIADGARSVGVDGTV